MTKDQKLNLLAFGVIFSVTGLLFNIPTRAAPLQYQTTPMFENVTLSPDSGPGSLTIRGLSGGPISSQNISGREETPTGPCMGFVDEKPDHKIVLTGFFKSLSLRVQSSEDTVLVVRGPGGSWCNDDYQDMNPGIAGQWLSGTYEIWVGSYEPDSYHPYVLEITKQ
jgi:hypothetical protein